mmetsp:Transcript_19624/g.42591  ORF Transcript_19624/g.42591 Transcript_19624/m.42591 type:complete len:234 (-) Transcript_19624:471-1172(-)
MPTPNAISSTYGGACRATLLPRSEPTRVPVPRPAAINQSTLPRRACWARPTREGSTMDMREVPRTCVCGMPVNTASAGVTMVPPPMPSSPDAKPAKTPVRARGMSPSCRGLNPRLLNPCMACPAPGFRGTELLLPVLLLPVVLPVLLLLLLVVAVALSRAGEGAAVASSAAAPLNRYAFRGTKGATKYSQYPRNLLRVVQLNMCVALAPSGAMPTADTATSAAEVRSAAPLVQ